MAYQDPNTLHIVYDDRGRPILQVSKKELQIYLSEKEKRDKEKESKSRGTETEK